MSAIRERTMPKKKMGRPPSGRDDVSIKCDRGVVTRLKRVAEYRGRTLADLASELLDAPSRKLYGEMLRETDNPAK